MAILFGVCFYSGVFFAVLSFVLGQLFGLFDGDGGLDFEGDVPDAILPIKPITVVSFVTVFGGVGLISLGQQLGGVLALVLAMVSGLAIATLLYRYVVLPLQRAQNTSTVSQEDLVGRTGKVALDLSGDRFGSITYVVNGNSYTAPARSLGAVDLHQGEEVIIVRIQDNVFYVERSDRLFG